MKTALEQAISNVGSGSEMARRLGISRQAVNLWNQAPVARVLTIERISGVTRYELRPDIYGEA